jgi:RNA polymerase sigma-70 factor (ECF subfamily)
MADLKGDPSVREAVAGVTPADEVLAERLVGGDPIAFEALVDRHGRRVRTLCYRMSGSLSEADDLAQETFLRVYRHRGTYQAGKPFGTWLHRICVNVCLTHRERQRRQPPVARLPEGDRRPPPEAPAGASADPEARAAEAQLVGAVQRIVGALAEPFRTTLILRVFAGLSYQEIADVLGCGLGTVMSRINRARAQVRGHMKDLVC